MLKIKPEKQNTSYSCGPVSLKMILNYYGVNRSEKSLIKLASARKGYGCDPDDLVQAAEKLGFKAIYKQNSSIKEIKHYLSKKIPVIVDWFSPTALGHYSVVVGLDRKNLIYADPQFGRIKKMKVDQFENRWFELDDYPPKNQAKFALREIVVVFPKLEN